MPRNGGYWDGCLVEYGFGSDDMEDGITFGCFLVLSSLVFFGCGPGINSVGMGFYHLQSQSSGGGFFPCARSTEKSLHMVQIGCGTYGFIL